MKIFDVNQAKSYCSQYSAGRGNCQGSLRTYFRSELKNINLLREGTTKFNEYRDCVLRNVERFLFLAASNYKTSHELMRICSASWSHVTLYYASYFSASAILGMFGAYIETPYILVKVRNGDVGSQELEILRNKAVKSQTTYGGNHQMFWDFFYRAVRSLHAWIQEPELLLAIKPISSDPCWQINNRNEINYDSFKALDLSREFSANFNLGRFPSNLPGILNTQFTITESLVLLAFKYARDFGVSTDALDILSTAISRGDKIDALIFNSSAGVVVESSKRTPILS